MRQRRSLPAGCSRPAAQRGSAGSGRRAGDDCGRVVLVGEQAGLRFEVGVGAALSAEDATYDAAFGARLLLHVADPFLVVAEMARVVKPGGRVVLMDWDFETVTVSHPDRELTWRLLHWRCDHHSGDNWSGRRLLGHALGAGLRDVTVVPVVTVARDEAAALTGSMFRVAEVALRRWRCHVRRIRRLDRRVAATACRGTVPGQHHLLHRSREALAKLWATLSASA